MKNEEEKNMEIGNDNDINDLKSYKKYKKKILIKQKKKMKIKK